jgi:hypothetical protein
MALIITNGNTSLNTASGFYRVEAYNWGAVYVSTSGHLTLTTSRTIDVTFANAGNLQGVVLCLMNTFNQLLGNSSAHCTKDVNVWFEETKSTCTMTVASPCVVTKAGHGLVANQEIEFTTTGALPTGLTAGTKYFVRNETANTFEVSLTSGGASINTTGTQSGTHTLWAIRDSKTLTASQIMNTTDNSCSGILVPFEMTTPYAVDTTASKWRYRVSQGSGTNNWQILASSVATPTPIYAAWCDNAVTFADNDSVIAKDVLTLDKTATLKGILGAGNTSIAWALTMCRQTDPTVANVCNVVWENPPASSYTITIDGCIITSGHSGLRIGTSADPIAANKQAVISFISPTVGTASGYHHTSGFGVPAITRTSLFCYGDYLATRETTLASAVKASTVSMTIASPCVVTWTSNTLANDDAICFTTTGALPTGLTATTVYYVLNHGGGNTFNLAATPGGAAINTSGSQSGSHTANTPIVTTDTTGWTVGSVISVGGSNTRGATDMFNVKRTIATISGTMITLNANLAQARVSGGKVINWSEGYGIQIKGYNALLNGVMCAASNIHVEGVESRNGLILTLCNNTFTWNHEDSTARSKYVITNSSFNNCDSLIQRAGIGGLLVPPDGFELSNCHGGYYNVLWYYGFSTAGASGVSKSGEFTVTNNYLSNAGTSFGMGVSPSSSSVIKPIITDNYFEGCTTAGGVALMGYGGEFSRNTFFSGASTIATGAYIGALTLYNAINFTGTGNVFDNCAVGVCLGTGYQSCEFTDTVFGPSIANATDIVYDDGTFPDYQENSPTGAVVVGPSFAGAQLSAGSVRIRDYNDTIGDYRSTVAGGTYASSSGDLVGRTTQTTDAIETEYLFLTGDINTFKLAVVLGAQIASAAYYAGTFTAPTLSVVYGTDAAVTDTAASSTSAQTLVAITNPASSYKNLTVTLSQKTDATGTDADVTWSDLKINTRKYGYTFGSIVKAISEIIPYVYGEVTTPTVNTFITESTVATVAAYTGIAVDNGTQTITVSSNHTLEEVYDYLQYLNSLDAGMEYDEYLSTIDGTVYTSPYNFVVDNCALSASGHTIDVGSMDFSLVGTATYDGKWIDAGGTYVPIQLTGLVSGSTVYIRNTTDASTIYKAVVSATSLLINQAYTANKSVTITVRKSDYLNYSASTTLTSAGISAIIAQQADDIYTGNGIDGSTVTEFSLSGATVLIYVDDPDNATSAQRMYNWYKYILATTTYIDQQEDLITAQTAWSYVLDDTLKIYNQDTTNTLFITGANINNASSTGAVIDSAGGSININGYFPFNSLADITSALGSRSGLTLAQFLALK